jgi:hypothetical protein
MKKIFMIISLLTLYSSCFATDTEVSSKIDNVTVFLRGAQVTSIGSTNLPAGTTELLFKNLSADIDPQSIKVEATGDFTVMSVVHQFNYLEVQEKSNEIKTLEEEKKSIISKLELQTLDLNVYREEENLILENRTLGSQQQGVRVDELQKAADFYRLRLSEIRKNQLQLNNQIKDLNERLNKINSQLGELNATREKPTSEIRVTVSAKMPVKAEFFITYLVRNAGWIPLYDLHIQDVESPIEFLYKANVYQLSGMDWSNVRLKLSTADPSKSGIQPILLPWILRFGIVAPVISYTPEMLKSGYQQGGLYISGMIRDENNQPLPGVNIVVKGTTAGTITDYNGNFILDAPVNSQTLVVSYIGYETIEVPVSSSVVNITMEPSLMAMDELVITGVKKAEAPSSQRSMGKSSEAKEELMMEPAASIAPVTIEERTTNIEFVIEIPYTIPSDGKNYSVDIQKLMIPATYEYSVTPKLETDVFLKAMVIGWDEYNLLKGDANLYFEGTYIGKTFLNVNSVEDTLNISLGRDENIVVTREKVKEFSSKQFLGAYKKEQRGWEINVRNKKKQSIHILVTDQFPVSGNSEIEVQQIDSGGAKLDNETGILTWNLDLEPGASKKLAFKYSVRYPKKEVIILE